MTILTIIIKSYLDILLAVSGGALVVFALGLFLIIRFSGNRKRRLAEEQQRLQREEPVMVSQPASESKPKSKPRQVAVKHEQAASDSDINAISGDDPVYTQLDLARAYIESGKGQLARIILESVVEKGSENHQEEAKRLLSSI